MAFVVVIKKVSKDIRPEKIMNVLKYNNIPTDKIKYYESRNVNEEDNTYTLRIKFYSFDDDETTICNFYNELVSYRGLYINCGNDILKMKIKMKNYYTICI